MRWHFAKCILRIITVVNVAVGRPVNQSITWNDGKSWTADKAVDTNTCRDVDPDVADPRCCSATVVESGTTFWRINLEERFEVERLDIYARNGKKKSVVCLLSYSSVFGMGQTDSDFLWNSWSFDQWYIVYVTIISSFITFIVYPDQGPNNILDGFHLSVSQDGLSGETVEVTDSIPGVSNTYQKIFSPKKLIKEIIVTRQRALLICEFMVFAGRHFIFLLRVEQTNINEIMASCTRTRNLYFSFSIWCILSHLVFTFSIHRLAQSDQDICITLAACYSSTLSSAVRNVFII